MWVLEGPWQWTVWRSKVNETLSGRGRERGGWGRCGGCIWRRWETLGIVGAAERTRWGGLRSALCLDPQEVIGSLAVLLEPKKKSCVDQVFRWPCPTDGMILDYHVREKFHKSIVIVVFWFYKAVVYELLWVLKFLNTPIVFYSIKCSNADCGDNYSLTVLLDKGPSFPSLLYSVSISNTSIRPAVTSSVNSS